MGVNIKRYETTSWDSDIDNTVTALITGPGDLMGMELHNPNITDVYIQFFDALVADVTLGTTAPTRVYELPAGGSVVWGPSEVLEHFSTAITYAVTTTNNGLTDPTLGAQGQIKYKQLGIALT